MNRRMDARLAQAVRECFERQSVGYSPEDPEDAFEPVGPYTAEDLAFIVDAQVEEGEPQWISSTQETSE